MDSLETRVQKLLDQMSLDEKLAQRYIYDEFAWIPRPVKELKAYRRISLAPDEVRQITVQLPVNQLAFHDADLNLIVEAGKIHVMVGSSSEDIRLRGEFEITGARQTIIHDRIFSCPVLVK